MAVWEEILGNYYQFVNQPVTFWEAVTTCQASGGKLVEPKSVEVNQAVAERFSAMLGYQKPSYWIGITDIEHEGEFRYVSEPLAIQFHSWFVQYEPSNSDGVEHCAHVWDLFDLGFWNDAICSAHIGFVCERNSPCWNNYMSLFAKFKAKKKINRWIICTNKHNNKPY